MGTYKASAGTELCTPCALGLTTFTTGGTKETDCVCDKATFDMSNGANARAGLGTVCTNCIDVQGEYQGTDCGDDVVGSTPARITPATYSCTHPRGGCALLTLHTFDGSPARWQSRSSRSVSYTHLTLPTILLV